ncbi:MAG: hypothetical protein KC636_36715 [Myxococcales bacterium]|nr:hypothetical protein [Myxococcales bacterium]
MEAPISTHTGTSARLASAGRTTAVVLTRSSMHRYELHDLQVAGARLRGGPPLPRRRAFEVILEVPCYPPIRLHARVVGPGDDTLGTEVAFIHETDFTEDHIQAALLSELERSRTPN